MAVADRLTRAAAADGAELIVLPEKWTAMGSQEDLRAGAEALDGAAIAWARAIARELRVDLVAGSILERVPGQAKLANTSVHVDPHGEMRAVYRKLHMFDVEVGGRSYRESELEQPGDEIVLSRDRRRRGAGPVDLLRPALPGALPDTRGAGCALGGAAGGVHAGDHARALGGAGAGAGDREPGVRDRRQPGGRAPGGPALGRTLDDRGPVGRGARAGAGQRRATSSRSSISSASSRSARACRRWPTAARRPTAGRCRRRWRYERLATADAARARTRRTSAV